MLEKSAINFIGFESLHLERNRLLATKTIYFYRSDKEQDNYSVCAPSLLTFIIFGLLVLGFIDEMREDVRIPEANALD